MFTNPALVRTTTVLAIKLPIIPTALITTSTVITKTRFFLTFVITFLAYGGAGTIALSTRAFIETTLPAAMS